MQKLFVVLDSGGNALGLVKDKDLPEKGVLMSVGIRTCPAVFTSSSSARSAKERTYRYTRSKGLDWGKRRVVKLKPIN